MRKLPVILWMLGVCIGIFSSCQRQASFILECQLKNDEGRALYLTEIDTEKGPVFIDSIFPHPEGHYYYKLKRGEKGLRMFSLSAGSDKDENLILIPFSGEKICFSSDYNHLALGIAIPMESPAQQNPNSSLLLFQKNFATKKKTQDSLARIWTSHLENGTDTDTLFLDIAHQSLKLEKDLKKTAIQLCQKFPGSLIPVYMVNKTWNNKALIDPMENDQITFLKGCCDQILEKWPDNSHALRMKLNLERIESHLRAIQLEEMAKKQTVTEHGRDNH